VLNIEDQAIIPFSKSKRSCTYRTIKQPGWGRVGIKWHAKNITSPYFFLDGFQAIICSALKLPDKGKRKKKKVYQSQQVRE
jgi:hypothetical protein